MSEKKDSSILFDLALYLLAETFLMNPKFTDRFRLLEGVNRVIRLSERMTPEDEFLKRMKREISDTVILVIDDREKFESSLDNILLEFTEELKRRFLEE